MIAPRLEETSIKPNSPSESPTEDLISGVLGNHAIAAMPMKKTIRAAPTGRVGPVAYWRPAKRAF